MKILKISAGVRYWEDGRVNGVQDISTRHGSSRGFLGETQAHLACNAAMRCHFSCFEPGKR